MRSGYHPALDKGGKKTLKEQGFYHTKAWRSLRKEALQRDHYLCQLCLAKHRITPATEVHHIKELEDYPELGLELSNLQSLCWYCHEGTKYQHHSEPTPPPASDNKRIINIHDGSECAGWIGYD